jgi:hypothetical protein
MYYYDLMFIEAYGGKRMLMLGWVLCCSYLSCMKENDEVFSVKEMVSYGCKDDSPFGDLCRDIIDDAAFPWKHGHSSQISYLVSKVSDHPMNSGLEDAVETALDYLQKRLDS